MEPISNWSGWWSDWTRPAATLTAGAALAGAVIRPNREQPHALEDHGQSFPADGSRELMYAGTAVNYRFVVTFHDDR